MKKYTVFSFLIALIMFAVSCGTSDGMMPRQTGDAASEVEEGLYLAHNVMWDLARDKLMKELQNISILSNLEVKD